MGTEERSMNLGVKWRRACIGRHAVMASLAMMLAACTVGPELRKPETVPVVAWSPDGTRALDAALPSPAVMQPFDGRRWWSVFGDPVLDALVADAIRQNLDLQTTALRIETARAQRDAAVGARYPNVEASTIAGRARQSENGIGKALAGGRGSSGGGASSSAPPTTTNLFQVGFDATWEIDLFGRTRRNIEAADADVRAAVAARQDAQVSLVAEVTRAYVQLRGSERQLDIAKADVATQTHLQQLVGSRNRAGLVATSDVDVQQAQVASAEAQVAPLEQAIAQARNQLALLLALPPGGLGDRLGAALPPRLPPQVPIGLPSELLRRRPDIRQREAEIEAATARVGVATASLFPSIRLGASGGLQATEAHNLFDWASRFLLGGVQLSLPIFEGGRLHAQVRISDLQSQQAVIAYRQAVLSAFSDVDNALIAYAAEQRRALQLQQQVVDAQHGRVLAEARYKSGLAAYIEVLDAERNAHQAEQALADSTVSASTDLVALFKALGGGWEDEAVAAR